MSLSKEIEYNEMEEFPENWKYSDLGDICTVDWGNTSLTKRIYSPDGFPAYSASGQDGFIDFYEHEGDAVILSAIGARCGKCFWATGKWTAIKNTIVIKPKDLSRVDMRYLFFKVNDESFWPRSGSGQPFIGIGRAKTQKIPLPPLPEQQAIAHVLTTVRQAIEVTEGVIAAARELKRSMMKHLFTYGPVPVHEADQVPLKETEIGEVPECWKMTTIGELANVKGGKRLPKGHSFSEESSKYPYIRVTDFSNWSVNTSNLKYITEVDWQKIKKYTISQEDVYISIAGTIGLVGTVPKELDSANLTENAAKIVILDKAKLNKHYFVAYLASQSGQIQIRMRTTKHLNPNLPYLE